MNHKYRKALVIDSAHIARSIISTERAFIISYKGNAEIKAVHPETFGLVNKSLVINKPSIIIVKSFINLKHQTSPCNRTNIYKRDNYECVYCGHGRKSDLTLDHVLPKAKGGKNTWNNLVTSCKKCNSEKADMILEDFLALSNSDKIINPRRPHFLMLMKSVDYIPKEWKQYLFY